MTENEVGRIVVDASLQIHRSLGPGLLESVYETVLSYELTSRGLQVGRQVPVSVIYGELTIDAGFRADIVVEDLVILELKSLEKVSPVHKKQLLTYLRLSGMRLGFLLNFGEELMRNGITRLVNGLDEGM
jgi:GxxExxY protein